MNPSTVPRATPSPISTQGQQRGQGQKLLIGVALGEEPLASCWEPGWLLWVMAELQIPDPIPC